MHCSFLIMMYELQRLHRAERCEVMIAYGKSEGTEEEAIVASSDREEPRNFSVSIVCAPAEVLTDHLP
jgi:hypothetical protein